MLPILIACHARCEPPGYLCSYFDSRQVPYKKIHVDEQTLSAIKLSDLSGLILMGGPHSVNDDHPWIVQELELIQQAVADDIPLMGVCFGAQMISKALGGQVSEAPAMETGWHHILLDRKRLPEGLANKLPDSFEVFQWHEDTFSNPQHAIPVFSGSNIENQGYLLGKVLTMQFHLEMTEHMVQEWLARYNDCLPMHILSVQSPLEITERLHQRLDNLHAIADKIYDWWLGMVDR
ncbi:MAG: type 1 glutamine amidotransferase [Gammaproteobacteria bacterium]